MKKINLIKLISASLLFLFISCNEEEEINEVACELTYEAIFYQTSNPQIVYFETTASVTENEAVFFWSINGEELNTNTTNLEYVFTENGTYTVCVFTETPECPQGVQYCEDIIINTNEETEITEEISCFLSFETEFDFGDSEIIDLTTQKVTFEATAEVTEGETVYYWSINDAGVEGNSNIIEHTFTKNGTYNVIVSTETAECGVVIFSEELTIDNIVEPIVTECPSFGIKQNLSSNDGKTYLLYLDDITDPNNTLNTVFWEVVNIDTQETIVLNDTGLETTYTFTESGTYIVCASETSCDFENCSSEFEVSITGLTVIPGQSIQNQFSENDTCPNITHTFSELDTTLYNFEAFIDQQINEQYVYFWEVFQNGDYIGISSGQNGVDSGKDFQYTFEEASTYTICVGIETPDCGGSIKYCTDFVVQ